MTKSLQIAVIKAADITHRIVDFILPWLDAGEGKARSKTRANVGIIGLLAGMTAALGITLSDRADMEEGFDLATKASVGQGQVLEGFQVDLPMRCGGGEYYIISDDQQSIYKASDIGAKALSIGEQFTAANKIDSCLERMAGGQHDLADDFKVNSDVKFSAPVIVSYVDGRPQSSSDLMGVYLRPITLDALQPLSAYVDRPEDMAQATEFTYELWHDHIYKDMQPQNMTVYVDAFNKPSQSALKDVQQVHFNKMGEFGVLALGFGAMFAFGGVYSAFAGSGANYRKRHNERAQKLAALEQ